MDEPDPAVELRVPGEALLDAGHADQDHAELAAVVVVAELFQGCGPEPSALSLMTGRVEAVCERSMKNRQGYGKLAGSSQPTLIH